MGAISAAARSTALMAWIGAISLCVLGNGAFAFPYTFSYNYMQPKEGGRTQISRSTSYDEIDFNKQQLDVESAPPTNGAANSALGYNYIIPPPAPDSFNYFDPAAGSPANNLPPSGIVLQSPPTSSISSQSQSPPSSSQSQSQSSSSTSLSTGTSPNSSASAAPSSVGAGTGSGSGTGSLGAVQGSGSGSTHSTPSTSSSSSSSSSSGSASATAAAGAVGGKVWCISKPNVDEATLMGNIVFACGEGGVNCAPIQPGGACFKPNTLTARASFVMNLYYQRNQRNWWTCHFNNTGLVVFTDPSYGDCIYSPQ